jgi:hypothetical protein
MFFLNFYSRHLNYFEIPCSRRIKEQLSLFVPDLCKTMLREGKGSAFALSPASGVLVPFSDQTVVVTAFCDMWGEYKDQIICKVSATPTEKLA